jgi:putative nucleotidyltransferase with HDIG domain
MRHSGYVTVTLVRLLSTEVMLESLLLDALVFGLTEISPLEKLNARPQVLVLPRHQHWNSMRPRTDLLLSLSVLVAVVMGMVSPSHLFGPWQIFVCYLGLGLIGACFKVALPGGEIALSFNVPYILLSIMWLPLPAVLVVAAASALVICTFSVSPRNTLVQILFHLANAINSAFVAWFIYYAAKKASGQLLPSLVFAATAYFVVNSLSVAAVLATLRGKPLFAVWRHFFWAWPYYPVGAVLALLTYYVEVRLGRFTAQMVLPLAYILYRICKSYSGRLVERHKHGEDMAALHLRTMEALALAIEAKDRNTHDHLCRVRVYAAGIATAMNLKEDEREALMAAALLHDIGKLAVPEYILNKPGRLTPEEFDRMKIHPVVGAQILERVSFPYPVVPIVRSHHEHWDGTGYPDGLKGEEIPVGARILAVIDCFDAMASDRPYRRALPISGAVAHVQKLAGIEFDPQVVRILAQLHDELEGKALAESRKMEPLKTDITVRKGEAPSAGYERSGPAPGSSRPGLGMDPGTRAKFEAGIRRMIAETLQTVRAEDSLACVSATLAAVIPFDILMIYVLEDEVLRPYYVSGNRAVSLSSAALPVGQGLCGWVAQSRQHILNGNPSVEVEIQTADPRISQMHSSLALPLVNAEDSVLGVLALYHSERDAFSVGHLDLLLSLQESFSGFLLANAADSTLNQPQSREEEISGVAIV